MSVRELGLLCLPFRNFLLWNSRVVCKKSWKCSPSWAVMEVAGGSATSRTVRETKKRERERDLSLDRCYMPTSISWHSSLSRLGHAIGLSHASETRQSLPVVSSNWFGEESVALPGQPSERVRASILSPHCLRSLLWRAYKMASFQDFWTIGRSCRIFCGWVEDTCGR